MTIKDYIGSSLHYSSRNDGYLCQLFVSFPLFESYILLKKERSEWHLYKKEHLKYEIFVNLYPLDEPASRQIKGLSSHVTRKNLSVTLFRPYKEN